MWCNVWWSETRWGWLHNILGKTAIYVKYLMSNILEKAFWCLQPFQSLLLLENAKKIRQKSYLAIMNKSGTYIDYHV